MKVLLSAVLLLSAICFSHAAKLKVSIYYGTLSPRSATFFRTQLMPIYKELAEYINLELVPFGKGTAKKRGDHWEFRCLYGPVECEINAWDSCAVDIAPIPKAVAFTECILTKHGLTITDRLKSCAKESGISYESLAACRQRRGDELLARNAERSKEGGYLKVPAVLYNDEFHHVESELAVTNLKLSVCSQLKDVPLCRK
nr:unnamed protein product [Callosobruchus analis]